jgi:hypothetical protein
MFVNPTELVAQLFSETFRKPRSPSAPFAYNAPPAHALKTGEVLQRLLFAVE